MSMRVSLSAFSTWFASFVTGLYFRQIVCRALIRVRGSAPRDAAPPDPNLVDGGELLDPLVIAVDHVHVAVRIHGYAVGIAELAGAAAAGGGAPLRQRLAHRRELLDAAVASVGDVHVPPAVHRHAGGVAELAWVAAGRTPLR